MTTVNRSSKHVSSVLAGTNSEFAMGRILRDAGKLTDNEVEQVLRHQQERGLRFGEAAVEMRLVTSSDVAQALSQQFHFPCLPVEEARYAADLVTAYRPASAEAEAVRAMRSQLSLRWFTADRKKLTVASVNSGDGGSMLIANLAISFSQLGMRTLVVDANLRQPTQHRIFNLGSRRGLSDVIAGRAGLETISTLDLFGGLAIMPAGTPPPNPTELVSGLAFRKLLDDLTAHADIILCDAPAFMAAADTVSISSCTGGVLLVTRKHKTSLNDVRGISQQLAGTNIRTVGSVLLDF